MITFDNSIWTNYCSNTAFQNYVENCRAFDPVGYDRAILRDEESKCFDFRRVIVEAFIGDMRSRPFSAG